MRVFLNETVLVLKTRVWTLRTIFFLKHYHMCRLKPTTNFA
jgi:hypothetical protein